MNSVTSAVLWQLTMEANYFGHGEAIRLMQILIWYMTKHNY